MRSQRAVSVQACPRQVGLRGSWEIPPTRRTPPIWPLMLFQAEGGIRDLTVTGVQTCALPIFLVEDMGVSQFVFVVLAAPAGVFGDQFGVGVGGLRVFVQHLHVAVGRRAVEIPVTLLHRSEERRVGKEGRSRGSPYH